MEEIQQTQTTDSSDEVVENVETPVQAVEVEQEEDTLESLFDEEGTEDVEGKSEVDKLSLSELNTILKRDFKTKEEALKSIEGLKNLVGDQKLAKERKEKPKTKSSEKIEESEVAILRKELAAEKFYSTNPTAQGYKNILEAYAKANELTVSEAWESEDFKPFAESSQKKPIITNNRLNPVTPRVPLDLIDEAKKGSDKAKLDVVDKWFAGKK